MDRSRFRRKRIGSRKTNRFPLKKGKRIGRPCQSVSSLFIFFPIPMTGMRSCKRQAHRPARTGTAERRRGHSGTGRADGVTATSNGADAGIESLSRCRRAPVQDAPLPRAQKSTSIVLFLPVVYFFCKDCG